MALTKYDYRFYYELFSDFVKNFIFPIFIVLLETVDPIIIATFAISFHALCFLTYFILIPNDGKIQQKLRYCKEFLETYMMTQILIGSLMSTDGEDQLLFSIDSDQFSS